MIVLEKHLRKIHNTLRKVRDFVNTNKNRAPEKEVQTRPFGKKPESKVHPTPYSSGPPHNTLLCRGSVLVMYHNVSQDNPA